jgi:lipopolysaccharide/colanic/teichoic acid biosynthesis glycosyltransferase
MAKRLFDISFALLVLALSAPVMLWALWRVWSYDRRDPLYRAPRVGRGNRDFTMLKIRSMTVDADKSGVASTSAADTRITPVGHLIRRWKLDELSQFWNVLMGDMSVVGPRPQVRKGGVDRYTAQELRLLTVRPGITDISSIVFSDEGEILAGRGDPDAAYEALVRPWKSRLGLFYIDHRSLWLDLRLVYLTGVAIVSRRRALAGIDGLLERHGADATVRRVCRRDAPLEPALPPGADGPARSLA